jgi:hypothetical protein
MCERFVCERFVGSQVHVCIGTEGALRGRALREEEDFNNRLSISHCYEKRTTRHRAATEDEGKNLRGLLPQN